MDECLKICRREDEGRFYPPSHRCHSVVSMIFSLLEDIKEGEVVSKPWGARSTLCVLYFRSVLQFFFDAALALFFCLLGLRTFLRWR